jgi:hypothetical protein
VRNQKKYTNKLKNKKITGQKNTLPPHSPKKPSWRHRDNICY